MAQLCAVCEATEAKYKCPTCRAPYCSLVCCKKHKETPCEPPPASEKPQEPAQPAAAPASAMEVNEDAGERLTDEQMGVLTTSVDVKEMLANPAIRETLTQVRARDRSTSGWLGWTLMVLLAGQIDSSQDKMKTLEKALLDPAFAKFMYQALDEVVPAK
jgi:hypothetical protein